MSPTTEWGVADDIRVLRRDGYNAAANRMESLSTSINKDAEMQYMLDFIRESEDRFSDDVQTHNQFRALWTAFCFHHDLVVDTDEYDVRLITLWDNIPCKGTALIWEDFYSFMCELLV